MFASELKKADLIFLIESITNRFSRKPGFLKKSYLLMTSDEKLFRKK